jgi:hypothetical protein
MHETVLQAVYHLGKAIKKCVKIETEHGRSNESDSGFETSEDERGETATERAAEASGPAPDETAEDEA